MKHVASILFVAVPALAQWDFSMDRRPSITWGENLKVDFRLKVQNDFAGFASETVDDGRPIHEIGRFRVGIEGTFLKQFDFELDAELTDLETPIRDAFVNWRAIKRAQIQVGRFNLPFSREQLTSPSKLDFVYRSRVATFLAPGRDTGVMAHGRVWNKTVAYQVGVFRNDGDTARDAADNRTGGVTVAARVVARPLRMTGAPRVWGDLEIGAAVASSEVAEGISSLRGRSISKAHFFRRMDVQGQRLRTGAEASWKKGPVAVTGEWIQTREQRKGQSVYGDDLPDLISRGWYVSGAWQVFSKETPAAGGLLRSLLRGPFEAVELVGRMEQLRFASGTTEGRPSRAPRAAHLIPQSERALTFGANWTVNRHVRVQFNSVFEKFEDPLRSPGGLKRGAWSQIGRVQFGF